MTLIRADARSIPLPDESVDLIVTSPPYFALRSYRDGGEHFAGQIGSEPTPQEFLEALWTVTAECKRVLKPSGSMFANLGDKYCAGTSAPRPASSPARQFGGLASGQAWHETDRRLSEAEAGVRTKSLIGLPWRFAIGCIDDLGLILRAEIVWNKPSAMPESVTDRVRRSHEQVFHFTKEPRYFAAVDEVREPASRYQRINSAARATAPGQEPRHFADTCNPLGKLPGSVWTIPSEPLKVPEELGVEFFAAFPQELPRRIILGWSPSGICVECGEGRRPARGRPCERCGEIVEAHTKTCLSCGHRRGSEWRDGRYGHEAMLTDPHGTGTSAPRKPRATRECEVMGGYACACPEPSAPTRPAVVLDPFCGTGTSVMVAEALGRHGIGLDLSADYLRLARWRIEESGHARKTVRRTWNERHEELTFEGIE